MKIEWRLQTPFAKRTNYFYQRPAGFGIDSETAEKAGKCLPRCSWPDRGCRELRERRGKTPCRQGRKTLGKQRVELRCLIQK